MSRDAGFVGHGDVCLFTSGRMGAIRRHPELALPSRGHSTSALAIWRAESRSGCWNRRPAGFSTSAVPMREYKAVLEMETSGG